MKLSDALPDWAGSLPPVLKPAELEGLGRVLQSGRVSRFRRVAYVCRRAHRLAEVLDVPEGQLLILNGQGGNQIVGDVTEAWQMFEDGAMRFRLRSKTTAIPMADLGHWLQSPHAGRLQNEVELRCRCGRHVLDLTRPPGDVAAGIRRVLLLPKVAQRS